jgi:hypothetical protein
MQVRKLWPVGFFALAMAYAEAAVVVYLRRHLGIEDLMRDIPPLDRLIVQVEVGREAATLLMLLAGGWATGRTLQARLGFAFFAFGLWDIFYYAWLKVLLGWPPSLLAPDILFMIPLPWWGPVLSPVLVASLAAAGGARAVIADDRGSPIRPRPAEWAAAAAGTLAILYAFMADSLALLPASLEALNEMRPGPFAWPVFLTGLAALAWAVWSAVWRGPRRPRATDAP